MADFHDGEPVILRAALDREHWMCWRCCNCIAMDPVMWFTGLPIGAALYGLFGRSCREAEADSFSLVLTTHGLHFTQKLYQCGFCCQQTTTKNVPLDKIQDVVLVADCCADTCGYAMTKGKPWQLQIQTAGMGVQVPEVVIVCIKDLEGFRAEVLAAKRRIITGSVLGATGAPKAAIGAAGASDVVHNPLSASQAPASIGGSGADAAAVVAVLERIERALNEGLAQYRSQHIGAGK